MIKNIVFDLGRVLLSFDPEGYLRGKYPREKAKFLYDTIFMSKFWLELDRGTMSEKKLAALLSGKHPEYTEDIEFVLDNWPEMLTPIEGSVEVLEDLKGNGYRLFLISNLSAKAYDYVSNKYKFFDCFDKMLISSHVKMIKPERGIFRYLCDYCNIKPGESIFIDDSQPNIKTASKMGFSTILFKNPEQCSEEISKIFP